MKTQELEVYKNGLLIIRKVYETDFPKDEKYMLRQQFVRAAHSIVLNIAEGEAYYDMNRVRHLYIALGSCKECEAACDIYESVIDKRVPELRELIAKEAAMLNRLIDVTIRNTQSAIRKI